MSCDFINLALPNVRSLQSYQPGKSIEELARERGLPADKIVKLASNENPMGPPPSAIAAIQSVLSGLSRYPDTNGFELKKALAAHHNVDVEQITLGNGSNDVLVLLAESYLAPGISAIYSEHAFFIYFFITNTAGAEGIEVPSLDWGHDLKAMVTAIRPDTRMIFLANPNNPTGTYFDNEALDNFLACVPEQVLIVLDQAYFEYSADFGILNPVNLINSHPNLIVLRTFSKAYGLAGCRIGYAISHPNIADILNRIRQLFNVNSLAQKAALAALHDDAYLKQSIKLNTQGRSQLVSGLTDLGLSCIPSSTNFICVDTKRDSLAVYQNMLAEGVIVLPLGNYNMPQHLRISVGLQNENQQCLNALAAALYQLPE
ncbi:MAG: histidinol-phosphate transaminase [Candidatus Endonucleobacter bathymodioli]|uniref:Histidinol-phosphate aminotransferase n=1 Tax=Candidatus Endonucleibacter bathymodioli TaxID=539814 RepID=A0AA90NZU1_9GAMM|nr:histidinol-phosphate transaminase [Candidatus Endonucleobacter bathymodioli]